LLNEASQLLTAYVLPIRTHALHVYYSALVTIGHGSRLEVYTPSVPGLPRLLSEPYPDWETESLPDGHHKWIHCLAFSPDGTRIISGSSDFTARIWNALDGNELWCLQGHQKKVTAVAFSADSTRAITASYDKMLRVWDVRTGEHVMTLEGHGQCITALVVSPDGACVASASYDGSVRVWSLDDGKQVAILDGHDARVTSVAFSQDGKRIVSGAHNGDIRVWDARTGTETIRLEGHSQVVSSVALSPGGTRLVSGSNDCTVRVWDLRTGKQLAVLQEHHKECVVLVTFSPDGRWVTARYEDGRERSWSTNSIIDSTILNFPLRAIISLTISFQVPSTGELRFWMTRSQTKGQPRTGSNGITPPVGSRGSRHSNHRQRRFAGYPRSRWDIDAAMPLQHQMLVSLSVRRMAQ
jgi:WD40 repeat protein